MTQAFLMLCEVFWLAWWSEDTACSYTQICWGIRKVLAWRLHQLPSSLHQCMAGGARCASVLLEEGQVILLDP